MPPLSNFLFLMKPGDDSPWEHLIGRQGYHDDLRLLCSDDEDLFIPVSWRLTLACLSLTFEPFQCCFLLHTASPWQQQVSSSGRLVHKCVVAT